MKLISTVILATFIALIISGCSGHNMIEPKEGEMSSMDKPMGNTMKDDTMMEDPAAKPMKSDMEPMGNTM